MVPYYIARIHEVWTRLFRTFCVGLVIHSGHQPPILDNEHELQHHTPEEASDFAFPKARDFDVHRHRRSNAEVVCAN